MAGTPKFGKPFRRGDGRWVVPLYEDGGRQGQISVPSKEGVQDEAGALRYAAEEVVRRGLNTIVDEHVKTLESEQPGAARAECAKPRSA